MVDSLTMSSRNAVLYARVSSDDQTKGPSLEQQLKDCKDYATKHNMRIVGQYQESFTGTTLDRPAFKQVLQLLENGQANALVVFSHDRMSRNHADAVWLGELLESYGVDMHYVSIGKKMGGIEGSLTDSIMSLFADNERKRFLERCRRGKNGHTEKGRFMLWRPPYGYTKDEDKRLIPDPETAPVVQKIFQWYAYGDADSPPMSLHAICKHLVKLKIRGPSGKGWYHSTVSKMVRNETYIGRFHWGMHRSDGKGNNVRQPKDDWIEVDVPALIDEETFKIAQQRRAVNKRIAKRNRKNTYLLSGHIRCGKCGHGMSGQRGSAKKGARAFYFCNIGRYKAFRSTTHPETNCDNKRIAASRIEPIVVDQIVSLIYDENFLTQIIKDYHEVERQTLTPKLERLEFLNNKLKSIQHSMDRLVRRMAEVEDDDIVNSVSRTLVGLSTELDSFKAEQKILAEEVNSLDKTLDLEEFLVTTLKLLRSKLSTITKDGFREILNVLDIQITYHGDKEKQDDEWISIDFGFAKQYSSEIVNTRSCSGGHNTQNLGPHHETIRIPIAHIHLADVIYNHSDGTTTTTNDLSRLGNTDYSDLWSHSVVNSRMEPTT